MKKFLMFCLVLALIGGIIYGGYYLYNNTNILDRFFDIEEAETTCTVKFECNGGSTIDPQTVENGKTINHPGIPTREGFTFVGWYTNNDFEELFDFSTPIKKSCTVYARWVDTTDTTDTDSDGLTDPVEEFYGTDINKIDTDNDGLSDYQEIALFNLDPLNKDTDSNGINDGDEDSDADSLSNSKELSLGTNPMVKDTDGDTLLDSEELTAYKTNPLSFDTDEDGADDGWEVLNEFDPLVFNVTFDIIVKAENISEGSVISAQVQIQTDGENASSLKVEEVVAGSHALITESIPGYLGSAYDFSTKGEIESATITFEYDTSIGVISDEFQPRIYYFNEDIGILEELENQTVENGKISVAVAHFSKYILLNKVEFDKVWESEIKPPLSSGESADEITLDMIFVIDYSLSMDWNDPNQLFKQLSEEFINKLRDDKDKAGAVKFIRKATLVSELTANKENVISAIKGINYDDGYGSYSGTDGSAGIKMALDELSKSDAEYQFIVFITDGEDNGYSYSYDSLIKTANENGVTIYAVGMGSASEAVLKKISSQTGGNYYHATTGVSLNDVMNLDDVFKDIEASTIDLTVDTNYDGIPDYYNELIKQGILVLSNGSDQFSGIDFSVDKDGNESDDYDGDGIKNGDELIVVQLGDIVYMEMKSDPTKKDTDQDGFVDAIDPTPINPNHFLDLDHYIQHRYKGKYSATFIVKQPTFGSNIAINDNNDVGHTFVLLSDEQGHLTYFGFYPAGWENAKYSGYIDYAISNVYTRGFASTPGGVYNDQGHAWDIAYSKEITQEQYNAIIEYAESNADNDYNLQTYNCTTFAVQTLEEGDFHISKFVSKGLWALPPSYGALTLTIFYPYGYCPGQAGYDVMVNTSKFIGVVEICLTDGTIAKGVCDCIVAKP